MMIKRVISKLYAVYLKNRWHMNTQGANLLSGVFLHDYKNHLSSLFKVMKIHSKGYAYIDWQVNALDNSNYNKYFKTADYYAMHQLNGQYSHWIDDKLTLKYLCTGTTLDKYMPKYFFQIDVNGSVIKLPDYSGAVNIDVDDVIALLEKLGELAFKRIAGSLGEGFYKGVYQGGTYKLNNTTLSKNELKDKIMQMRDYIVTEYLHPHNEMIPFCADTVNTIRYLVGREENGKFKLLKSFIRFGTNKSGFVENYNAGGVLCYIAANGNFEYGNVYDFVSEKNIVIKKHPDTNVVLQGHIPMWGELEKAAEEFCEKFPQLKYLGIDFVVTSKNEVKILEINSLTSLDCLQLEKSILDSDCCDFYRKNRKKKG